MRARVLPLLALLAVALVAATASAAPSVPRMTVIGDSVSDAMRLDQGAIDILTQGVELNLQTAACRRLATLSCPQSDGTRPATALDLINALGPDLGSIVVLAVGYNDPEDAFPAELSQVLAALHKNDVQHILLLTLRANRHPYLSMNDAIRAAAAQDKTITIVDWNLYSRSHPQWFQPDGLHLAGDGAQAMASLIHRWLVDLHLVGAPLALATKQLPPARSGLFYAVRLHAAGGAPPYEWSLVKPLPDGFNLTADGRLSGTPAGDGVLRATIRVTDSAGARAARLYAIRVVR